MRSLMKDQLVTVLDSSELLLGHIDSGARQEVDSAFLYHVVELVDLLSEHCGLNLALEVMRCGKHGYWLSTFAAAIICCILGTPL